MARRPVEKLSEAFAYAASGDMNAHVRRRALVPSPSTLTPTISGNTANQVLWMSADGLTLFGRNATQLIKSVDDGANWTNVGAAFASSISGVRVLADGQLLVAINEVAGTTAGRVYRSSGYPSAPVFTLVLTCANPGAKITGEWGMQVHNNLVVLCEYGNKVGAGDIASKVYRSFDGGLTFSTIFTHTIVNGAHTHGAAYDPYDNRYWVATGDAEHATIQYSDNGSTWTVLTSGIGSQGRVASKGQPQAVGIMPLPIGVLFTTDDAVNGLWIVPRRGKNERPYLQALHTLESADIVQVIGATHYWRGAAYESLFPYIRATTGAAYLAAIGPNGIDAHTLWKDSTTYATPDGLVTCVGPTATGKYVGSRRTGANFQTVTFTAPAWVESSLVSPQRKVSRYLRLTGAAVGNAQTPDQAAFAFATDMDVRCAVALDDWTPAANQALVAQYAAGSTAFFFYVSSTTQLNVAWFPDGSTFRGGTASVALSVTDGDMARVRVTVARDVAGQYQVKFWTSTDYDVATRAGTWTQIGVTINGVTGPTTFFNSTGPLEVGATSGGQGNRMAGKFFWVEVRDGIDGTIVADQDFRSPQWKLGDTATAANAPTGRGSKGELWTLTGTSARIKAESVVETDPYIDVPIVTGSRGANAALADLLKKLAAAGILTDSTTA